MELKPGYKQTEVGVIPEDWDVDYVENLAGVTTGSRNTQDRINDGNYPFFVRSQVVEHINSYSFDGEAVLTAGDGVGTGKVFHYINGKFDVHQRVYRMSGFNGRINGYYFYLYFSSHFYNRIMQMTAKSSVDSVRRDMIARMLIPLPPTKAEQEAIAEALTDADALIESLEQLISKKRQIKQGAMQDLLTGKRRLPGFSGGWEERRLEESCELVTKGTTPTSIGRDFAASGINFLKAESINERGNPIRSKVAFIDEKTNQLLKRSQLFEGDVVISIAGVLGRVGLIDRDILPANTNQALAIIRLKKESKIERNYLFYYLRSPMITKQINDINVQAAQANISLQNIRELLINLPPSPLEQTAIATILKDMDTEITALETKLAKARQVKQGMMQELLTGRIRLI